MDHSITLYNDIVGISRDYLGPAGERFMRRQILTHLGKEPEELTQKDVPELVSWVRLTFALLTDDTRMIDAFTERLAQAAGTAPKKSRRSGVT